jgi:hypothetical protein
MPLLGVVSSRPVTVSSTGKVKARKRSKNPLGLTSVLGPAYSAVEDDNKKRAAAKKRKKAKAKKTPKRKRTANRKPAKKRNGAPKTYDVYTRDSRGTQGTRGYVFAGRIEGSRDKASALRIAKQKWPHYSQYKAILAKTNPAKRKAKKNRAPAKRKTAKKKGHRRQNPSTWGTSYFVSRGAAERYYKPYGYDNVKSAVAEKIRSGEIHIGRPPLKAGQKAVLLDGGKRYGITEGK